jgi:hypothetical protein
VVQTIMKRIKLIMTKKRKREDDDDENCTPPLSKRIKLCCNDYSNQYRRDIMVYL